MNNFCITDNVISLICQHEYSYFLNKTNVVGVGLGYKRIKNICTFQKAIVVLVCKKVHASQLSCENVIPSIYKGIPTDVIESGIFLECSLTTRVRPVTGGYSIGTLIGDNIGTMGCLVTDGKYNYILSCNHVLALRNTATIGATILQPALPDKSPPTADIVANLFKFIPLKFITSQERPENLADCAIARLTSSSIATSSITYVGNPLGIAKPTLNEKVKKVGRSTGLTLGTVTLLDATVEQSSSTGSSILLINQIITTKMSEIGDSGAVLLNDNNYVLGLLCGTSSYTCYNPINTVLNLLNVQLVTN